MPSTDSDASAETSVSHTSSGNVSVVTTPSRTTY
jgi:hypothetical protein